MKKDDLNAEMFFNECCRVLQSYETFSINHPMSINVIKIDALLSGTSRGRRIIGFNEYLKSKKSVISVRDDGDGLCFAPSLVLGKAVVDNMPSKKPKWWKRCFKNQPTINSSVQRSDSSP